MKFDLRRMFEAIDAANGPEDPGKPLSAYKGDKKPTPTGKSNKFSYDGGLESYLQEAQKRGLDVSNIKSAGDLQGRIYDSLMSTKEGQNIIRNMWMEYGDTLKGSGKVLPENLSESDLSSLKSSFVDEKLGGRTKMILGKIPEKTPPIETPPIAKEKEVEDISLDFGKDWMSTKSKMGPSIVDGVAVPTPTSRYGSMYHPGDNFYRVKYKDGTTDVLSVDEFNEMFPDEKLGKKVKRKTQGPRVYFEQGKGIYTVNPKTGEKVFGGKEVEGYL